MELSDGETVGENVLDDIIAFFFEVGCDFETFLFDYVLVGVVAGVVEAVLVEPAEAADYRVILPDPLRTDEETKLRHVLTVRTYVLHALTRCAEIIYLCTLLDSLPLVLRVTRRINPNRVFLHQRRIVNVLRECAFQVNVLI